MTIATVAIYARVSTDRTEQEVSLDEQQRRLRALAARKGWTVAAVYVDDGKSGTKIAGRDQFSAMLDAADHRQFDALLVTGRDRWARNYIESGLASERLGRLGIQVVDETTAELVDLVNPRDPGYWLQGAQQDVFNDYFSRLLGKKISAGRRGKATRGMHIGDVPLGYTRPEPRGGLVPDPVEAPIVRAVFERHATGAYSMADTARWLNTTGLRPHSKQGRTVFTKGSVKTILDNPVYVGDMWHLGEVVPATHEPIIDRDLWALVQGHRGGRIVSPRTGEVYLLSGIGRHAACEAAIWSDRVSVKGRVRALRYRCSSRSNGLIDPCQGVQSSCDRDRLDAALSALMSAIELPEDWRERVAEERAEQQATAPADEDGRQRRALEERRANARRAILDQLVPYEEAAATIRSLDAQIAALAVRAMPQRHEAAGAMLLSIHELWPAMTPEERRECVRLVLQRVDVDLGTASIVSLTPRPDFEPLFAATAAAGGAVRAAVYVRGAPGKSGAHLHHNAPRIYVPTPRAA